MFDAHNWQDNVCTKCSVLACPPCYRQPLEAGAEEQVPSAAELPRARAEKRGFAHRVEGRTPLTSEGSRCPRRWPQGDAHSRGAAADYHRSMSMSPHRNWPAAFSLKKNTKYRYIKIRKMEFVNSSKKMDSFCVLAATNFLDGKMQ